MASKRATNSHKAKQLTRAEKRFNKTAEELFGTHARSKLGKRRIEYVQEYIRLENRAKSWKKKHGIEFNAYPSHHGKINPSDIQQLKNITFKNISKNPSYISRKSENWRDYIPKTETDYLQGTSDDVTNNWSDEEIEEWYQREFLPQYHANRGLQAEAKMEEWLENKFNQILYPNLVERERENAREILEDLLERAKSIWGTKAFYEYLQFPDRVAELEDLATKYINSYQRKDGFDTGQEPLTKFATILNNNVKLTDSQAEELEYYGRFTMDYSDLDLE